MPGPAPRDENFVPTALFEVDGAPGTVMPGQINQITGRILVNGSGGGGGTVDTVVGTLNRISVNSADPANPIVDISTNYVGQASITTLGTITTGIWNGTDIALADGGTGASLTDPNADRIMFWDDSAGAVTWLTVGSGLTITGTTLDATGGGSGTVTSVSFTGGLISVATPTVTPALTVAGTSGGIVYFSSASTWATSAALAANSLVVGGGAGVAPSTVTTGTNVLTALGVAVGSAGAVVVNGGALGTPSSGTVTNLTGTASININGTVGATTPTTGVFTTLEARSTTSLLLGTAGSAVGNIGFRNATSGTITLAPTTGALGTVTLTLPAITDTLVTLTASQTLTNKTLTSPVIATIGSNTLTLGTGTFTTLTFDAGASDPVITAASGSLTVSTGDFRVTTAGTNSASVLTLAGTQTVTNKRPQPRTASSTTASTLTPDLSSANVYFRTTQTATLTINAPTGTPVIGETIAIYVDSAGAQTLTIDATYKVFGAAFPATTTAGKTFMMTAQFNGTDWKTLWANAV